MKKLLFGLFLTLTACGQTQFVPLTVTPVVEKRLVVENKQLVSLRADNPNGTYTTTTTNFVNLARIKSPSAANSFGDVQATGVSLSGNVAYVSYNTAGEEVNGAIDVVNVADRANPQILYTYTSSTYEFSDVIVKGNFLFLSGYEKEVGAILMVLDVSNPNTPNIVKIEKLSGIYATDLDVNGNLLLVSTGTTGGITEYNISNPQNIQKNYFKSYSNALSVAVTPWFNFILHGNTKTQLEVNYRGDYHDAFTAPFGNVDYQLTVANVPSVAPSRIKVKNALGYVLNTNDQYFRVVDLSGIGREETATSGFKTAGYLGVLGTANGFDLDNQKAYLAMGEKGVNVLQLESTTPANLGTMMFEGDNGSANNVWIETTSSNQKYMFIAYGRQGLRILSEQLSAPLLSSKIVVYAKGSSSNGQNPHIQIKVNGQIFIADAEIASSVYTRYEWNYTRVLTPQDNVQVILINDNNPTSPHSDINLYVDYLKVNDVYCYQSPVMVGNSHSDFGLYKNGQGIGYKQGACETVNDQGLISQCDVDEHVENNVCVNNVQSCSTANGTGTKTWNGTAYGACQVNTCNAGYTLQNGQCVQQSCSPNSTASCSAGNGTGTKVCAADGLSYGSCTLNSCNSGFFLNNGVCQAQTCNPGDQHVCVINHQIGQNTCNAQGSAFGPCVLENSCEGGFYFANGSCQPAVCSVGQTQACTINHQNGTQSCNLDGSGYGTCQGTGTCQSGYYLNNGQCVPQSCTPLNVASCTVSNGAGVQVCNLFGSGYGSCTVSTCNPGYHNELGSCVSDTKVCTSAQGTGTQTWNGLTYGLCQYNSCNTGFYLSGGVCLPQTCTPNAASSCAVNNGGGTHTCNAVGSGYGSCTTTSCNSGYTLQSGACVPQICNPGVATPCSSGNGTGTQTCSSNGLSYGSCTVNACNAGYTLQGGTCVQQLCAPSSTSSCIVPNGSGTKTCSADGMSYGSCSLTTCNSGFYNNNGTCTAQTCTPNSTASCSVQNGTGVKTCNAQGSAYGSCSVSSCSNGYAVVNGQCQQNLCPVSSSLGINTYNNVSVNSNLVGADNDNIGTLSYVIVTQPTKGTVSNFNAQTGAFKYTPNSNVSGSDSFTYKTNDTICDSPVSTVNISIQCSSGYYNTGSSCVAQVCNPNGTYSCSVSNGSGTKMCNSQGTGYGSCTANSCSSGYTLSGGVCVVQQAQVCSPNSTTSCTTSNGTGTKTCNAQGSAYGSCNATTCNYGYYASGGSCVPFACTPNSSQSCTIGAGYGNKYCAANGSGYGSCGLHSCQSGYYLENNECKPYLCTPNSSQSCSSANGGAGNKYCASDGLSWGSCQLHSCGSGYHIQNNTCVSNTTSNHGNFPTVTAVVVFTTTSMCI